MTSESVVVVVLGGHGMTGQAMQRLAQTSSLAGTWLFPTRSELDVRECAAVQAYLCTHAATHVINLAAVVGGIEFNMLQRVATLEDNLRIAVSVVRAAHEAGVQHMVSVLSTCIFPVRHQDCFDETMLHDGAPCEYNAGYAHAKRMLFEVSKAYSLEHGRRYVCLTPPNLYGPHDKFDDGRAHVMGALIRKFREAERHPPGSPRRSVVVLGSGAPQRQFMHCDDLARLLVWALTEPRMDPASPLIVAADDAEVSISALVSLLARHFAADIEVRYDRTKPDGQQRKRGCNARMHSLLPSSFSFTPLSDGVAETVAWYRSQTPLFTSCVSSPSADAR